MFYGFKYKFNSFIYFKLFRLFICLFYLSWICMLWSRHSSLSLHIQFESYQVCRCRFSLLIILFLSNSQIGDRRWILFQRNKNIYWNELSFFFSSLNRVRVKTFKSSLRCFNFYINISLKLLCWHTKICNNIFDIQTK